MKDWDKFRVWDGKEYVDPLKTMVFGDGSIYRLANDDEDFTIINQAGIIELCTGKQSEEGESVFQGDFMSWGDSYIEIVWDDAFVGFAIQRYFDGKKYGDSICAINFDFSKEKIIGNIRQNPELLKDEG